MRKDKKNEMGIMKMRIEEMRKDLEKGIGEGNREDEDKERRRIKKLQRMERR